MGVIENANTIHTVHTSLQYLIDVISKAPDDLNIYPRTEIYEPHSYYDYLFIKNYNYQPHPNELMYTIIYHLKFVKSYIYRLIKHISLIISTFIILNFCKE